MNKFLIRIISLLVAETFLLSSILPAWALQTDQSHLRPSASAKDGSAQDELIQELKTKAARAASAARDGGKSKAESTLSALVTNEIDWRLRFYRQKLRKAPVFQFVDESLEAMRWLTRARHAVQKRGFQNFLRASSLSLRDRTKTLKRVFRFEHAASRLLGKKIMIDPSRIFILPEDTPWFRYLWPEARGSSAVFSENPYEASEKEKGVVILIDDANKKEALPHELWHALGISGRRFRAHPFFGTFFAEGVTEYLTRVVSKKMGYSYPLAYPANFAFVQELGKKLGRNETERSRFFYRLFASGNPRPLPEKLGAQYAVLEKVFVDLEAFAHGNDQNLEYLPLRIVQDPTFGWKEYKALKKIFGIVKKSGKRMRSYFLNRLPPFDHNPTELITQETWKQYWFAMVREQLTDRLAMQWARELAGGKRTAEEIEAILNKRLERVARRFDLSETTPNGAARDGGWRSVDLPEARREEILRPSLEYELLLSP